MCVLPIDEKGMERREEQREEGDSERVEVREGGECVGSRGSLRSLRLERRKEQREEGDSKRVGVREGRECVGSRGSLRSARLV